VLCNRFVAIIIMYSRGYVMCELWMGLASMADVHAIGVISMKFECNLRIGSC